MSTDNLTTIISNGGMQIGDWITLAAVIVALGLGIASIIQTNIIQKRERKERLLNEIIEWSEQLLGFYFQHEAEENTGGNLLQRCQTISIKQTYIKNIVLFFNDSMFSEQYSKITAVPDSTNNPLQKVIDGLHKVSEREVELRQLKIDLGVNHVKVLLMRKERQKEFSILQTPIQELCDKTHQLLQTAITKKIELFK